MLAGGLTGLSASVANEEAARVQSVTYLAESKAGATVPRSLVKFVESEFYRHAIRQSERALPVGTEARPAIYAEPSGGGAFLVVEIRPRGRQR